MAMCGDARLFLAIFVITCCLMQTLAEMPSDCCLSVQDRKISGAHVVHYYQQISGNGCLIDAVIFVTKHGRTLCVLPGKPWVKKIMKRVDRLNKMCQKENHKNPRCVGAKRYA